MHKHSGDSPVYAAEDDFWLLMDYASLRGDALVSAFGSTWPVVSERRFGTLEQMDDFVQIAKSKALKDWPYSKAKLVKPVSVKWRPENQDFCFYSDGIIYVPDLVGQKIDWRLLHELAHHGGSHSSHGKLFVRAYLALMRSEYGVEVSRLFGMFLVSKGIPVSWLVSLDQAS